MKKAVGLILVLVMVLSLAACGGNSNSTNPPSGTNAPASQPGTPDSTPTPAPTPEPEGGPKYGGVMRWASSADSSLQLGLPQFLPSSLTTLLPPWAECLLLEASDGSIHPFLATEWDIQIENSKVIFTLRDDVYFTDGSQFNAEVVKWNIDLAIETKIMNPAVIGAEVVSEFEVAVLLSGYTNAVLPILASHSFCMVSKENYDKLGEEEARNNPVGTGPFIVTEFVPGQKIVYTRNDNYWQEGKPYLDAIEFVSITDVMTQNAAVLTDDPLSKVDVLTTAVGEQIQLLRDTAPVYVTRNVTGPLVLYPDSNNPDSPLAIQEVREAISYAIDRELICEARGFGIWQPAKAYVPPPYIGNKGDENFFEYNPEKSLELLAEAGYPDGFTIPMHCPAAVDRDAMVALQSMLGEVGIIAELSFPEAGAATELRTQGWDGIFVGTFAGLPSISSTYRLHVDPLTQFYPSMWRPYATIDEWRDLYESSRLTLIAEQEPFERMHEGMIEYMVCIPVYDQYGSYVINNRVHDSGWGEWGVGTMFRPWDVWVD